MKATDFNLQKDLKFDPSIGITSFKHNRFIILDSNAMDLLRQSLLNKLGKEQTRELFLQFGFENGFSDFLQMKEAYGSSFDTEMDLLASGPVIHSWEGIVNAAPMEIKLIKQIGSIFFFAPA